MIATDHFRHDLLLPRNKTNGAIVPDKTIA